MIGPAADSLPPGLEIRALTADLWPALEDLFTDSPVCSRCWCMAPRIGSAYRRKPAAANQADLHAIVMDGPPPGLLAFHQAHAVGWCQVTPRRDVPWLDRAWRLKRIDEQPVWSLSCFYVRKGYRRRGITAALIAAAIETARRGGAPALEAYPLDRTLTPSSTSTGVLTTFLRAGFTEVARHVPPRPIVRFNLRSGPGR